MGGSLLRADVRILSLFQGHRDSLLNASPSAVGVTWLRSSMGATELASCAAAIDLPKWTRNISEGDKRRNVSVTCLVSTIGRVGMAAVVADVGNLLVAHSDLQWNS